ncbi:hypothetical protein JCM10450v2_004898 [Rhodotorula kratochvilovae]
MSTQDSQKLAGPAVDLQDLPQELLAQIVVFVGASDDEIRESGPVAITASSSTAAAGTAGVSVQQNGFSDWYSRGVGALSLVNKSLRRLTLPHLCKSVTCGQLALPIVQFGRIPVDVLAGVETLDLRSCTSQTFAAATKVVHRLTGLRRLVSLSKMPLRMHGLDYAVTSFAAIASKVMELSIHGIDVDTGVLLGTCETLVAADSLRRLELNAPWTCFDVEFDALPQVLNKFRRLEVLHIRDIVYPVFSDVKNFGHWRGVRLERLRVLTLSAADLDVLAFVETVAPNIAHLTVDFAHMRHDEDDTSGGDNADDVALSCATFPHLRSLSLNGGTSCLAALTLVNLMSLRFLRIRINRGDLDYIDLADCLPSHLLLPAGLKVHLYTHILVTVEYAALYTLCDAQDAHLTLWEYGLLAPFSPPTNLPVRAEDGQDEDDDEEAEEPARKRIFALFKTTDWVERRAQQMARAGDAEGLVELSDALRRVEERRVIEAL